MAVKPEKIIRNKTDFSFFQYRKLKDSFLLTNDFGYYEFLSRKDFLRLKAGEILPGDPVYGKLSAKGFIKEKLDFADLFKNWKNRNASVFRGASLSIMVLTLRCNHKCLYCQSSAAGEKAENLDMSLATAKRSVDITFQSPSDVITIEFQGGEPLFNWNVLKETVKYARKKENLTGKKLDLAIVTNFTLMDEKKAGFLIKNGVYYICTSLDGPEFIHNKNRLYSGGNSHEKVEKWIRYFHKKARFDKKLGRGILKPNALLTVSRHSLPYPKEIVDEYARLKLEDIFIRPITPIGYAKKYWGEIGYPAEDFLGFYKKALSYILELNKKGVKLRERTARILLSKILRSKDTGYMDLRSPCGASIGQLAYNFNGEVYTCDEGRMVGWLGDKIFKAGTVKNSYEELIRDPASRIVCASSNLCSQPLCFRCAYRPYCGVCPVYNYESQGSIWGQMPANYRCATMMGIFDFLFLLLEDKKTADIFRNWTS